MSRCLNLGSGSRKIPNAINVDIEASLSPDVIADFTEPLPFESDEFDEVYLFHTIEHIQKKYHQSIFYEINRVMKDSGTFYLSYPEFKTIAQNWLDNRMGQRDFWEATIYGRQAYPNDYHLCAIDSIEMKLLLEKCGFRDIAIRPEMPSTPYNTVLKAIACAPQITVERLLYNEVFGGNKARPGAEAW